MDRFSNIKNRLGIRPEDTKVNFTAPEMLQKTTPSSAMERAALINSSELGEPNAKAIATQEDNLQKAINNASLLDDKFDEIKPSSNEPDFLDKLKKVGKDFARGMGGAIIKQQGMGEGARTANFANISAPAIQDTMSGLRSQVLSNIVARRR